MYDSIVGPKKLVPGLLLHKNKQAYSPAGDSVLDVGTGTAEVALAIANYMKKAFGTDELPAGSVLGVDPSEGMISVRPCQDSKSHMMSNTYLLVRLISSLLSRAGK
jgi:ubiquinone/menaquinone biosynthesis C-methylase UbiE